MSTKMNWLLLRGLGREKRHWRDFPDHLEPACGGQVLTLDLPGFGTENERRSPTRIDAIADDVRERFLRERAGISGAWSIMGISLGGMVALDWCARYEADFAHCVIVNSSARPSRPFERFRPIGLRTIFASLKGDIAAKERAVLESTSSTCVERGLDDLIVQGATWHRDRPPTTASLACQMRAAMTFELPASLDTPLLVLVSAADRLVSPRCSERIAEKYGAPIRVHPTGGHDLSLDAPEWICDALVSERVPRPSQIQAAE